MRTAPSTPCDLPPRWLCCASHQRGTTNVYADLGYKCADEMLAKAQLVTTIAEILTERGYTQTKAAAVLGIAQPKLPKMLGGQFRGISERKLMDCLTALGRDVEELAVTLRRVG
jgi:predicted XRE-type DNA-binding protein